MSRQLLITAATWTLLGTMIGRAQSPGPDVRTERLDLRSLVAHSAKVDFLPATPGAVRVTFQPAEWPNVKLTAPTGQAWNWNSHGFLLLAVRNPEQHEIELGIRIDDDVAADGKIHCRTALTKLKPGESTIVAMALRKVDPMVHGMRGLPTYPGSRSLNASGQGPFDLGHVVALQLFLHRPEQSAQPGDPIRATGSILVARRDRRSTRAVCQGGLAGKGSVRIRHGAPSRDRSRRPQVSSRTC